MKRFLPVASIVFSVILIGCGHDSRKSLVDETITMMKAATTEINNVTDRVTEATKRAREAEGGKLDLADAMKAADKLKDVSKQAQEIKRKVEVYRKQISDEDQKANSTGDTVEDLKATFKKLNERKIALRAALADASTLKDTSAKNAVALLREKIIEAEGPFESLTR